MYLNKLNNEWLAYSAIREINREAKFMSYAFSNKN